jgi:predicted CXXCH cytochrome family protein
MLAGGLTWAFWNGGRPVLQPGRTSDDHHVISAACSACHTPFVGVSNKACETCHQRELEHNTHPESVFDDPRWAASVEAERALLCTGCHREHQGSGHVVQLEAGFCFTCHDDIVTRRASHAAFAPSSCGDSGCHNYHDNSVLNEAFLRRELAAPVLPATAGLRTAPRLLARPAPRPAPAAAPQVPAGLEAPDDVVARWRASAHAGARVGCVDCHQPAGQPLILRPGRTVCAKCHEFAAATFLTGQHGVRERLGMSPLTPRQARLPMQPPSPRQPAALGCGSCHEPHRVDTAVAATSACLGCHADRHSLAFVDSSHARSRATWPGGAATCATCHMPRTLSRDRQHVVVEHGNTFTLRPRDRMLGSVCLDCHGLAFAMSSIYDDALVESNFRGRPQAAHQTLTTLRATLPREVE